MNLNGSPIVTHVNVLRFIFLFFTEETFNDTGAHKHISKSVQHEEQVEHGRQFQLKRGSQYRDTF